MAKVQWTLLTLLIIIIIGPDPASCLNASGAVRMEGINCVDGLIVPIWRPYDQISAGDRFGRGVLYILIMIYLFIGVSIASDRFMESIEMITAQEKEVSVLDHHSGRKEVVIVKVWNETVANLTLMALGSSAPEIMLSVIEIWAKNFRAGDLGPGTIVGSAAFNLFMIIGLCMYVIPDGQVRRIKHLRVFIVTAAWSVFAYIWLYVILVPSSYGIVEPWESILTFLFFPATVYTAYAADRRLYCYKNMSKGYRLNKRGMIIQTELAGTDSKPTTDQVVIAGIREAETDGDEDDYEIIDPNLAEVEQHRRQFIKIIKKIRHEHPGISQSELESKAEEEVRAKCHKSRAYYRLKATRKLSGKHNFIAKVHQDTQHVEPMEDPLLDPVPENDAVTRLMFEPAFYTVMENIGTMDLVVVRKGPDPEVELLVDYQSSNGTALAGSDYVEVSGTLNFASGVREQRIRIEIVDDDVFEEDEHFYVKLSNLRRQDGQKIEEEILATNGRMEPIIQLGPISIATIIILDDDHAGIFQFQEMECEINESIGLLELQVTRTSGARGMVAVPYSTEDGTAKSGTDYHHVQDELIFANEETSKIIAIPIIEEESYQKNVVMYVTLGTPRPIAGPSEKGLRSVNYQDLEARDPESLSPQEKIALMGKPRLGDIAKVQIRIRESKEFKSSVDRMLKRSNASMMIGASSWKEQFLEAFSIQTDHASDEQEDGEKLPTCAEYIMHFFTLFWKILFSLIPPVGLFHGYLTFITSILFIGLVTAVINDVASQLGCFIYLKDSVNAIALVALGTSIPDTFASKVAAIQDDTADASIGNVTGSNAVNVFLGIGIAWTMATTYWSFQGQPFKVSPGSLGFSVTVFCIEALVAIAILFIRRNPAIGGELGGPRKSKIICSSIFCFLWILYIGISALEAYKIIEPGF